MTTPTKTPAARRTWQEKDPACVPEDIRHALKTALELEKVALSHYDDLLWIIAQESSGRVGVRNGCSTARGLFQLLHMNYCLNPKGEHSFGDAVEECRGGIRYVMGRYQSAAAAKAFWRQHHWY